MRNSITLFTLLLLTLPTQSQDYFLKAYEPYDPEIPTPESFLGYGIGEQHTRHDRIVAYFETLAELSDKAQLEVYGHTYEKRPLIILTISESDHLLSLDKLRQQHLGISDPQQELPDLEDAPVFVNLGYNVHGNEPSSSEAAMLTAYTLIASRHPEIRRTLRDAVIFIDPVINPDGRDRHTHWANMYKGDPLVADPLDAEHNEVWPGGRTNHYWFDLNRDWLLGIHPESRGKLTWYHQWYPNVVTDFHEMGSQSTYFFEPMKTNGSRDPIMPKENYTTLNDLFGRYFSNALDSIGSFYFTKEVFDGTYPGYGSSYPDLQGGLGLLFEQASSRGHVQETPTGPITFPFTIRNQYVSGMATLKASVENKAYLFQYQKDFFRSALTNAKKDPARAYVFGNPYDPARNLAFLDKLLLHQVEVYPLEAPLELAGRTYTPGMAYVVPTDQVQYRMVQTMFETYESYTDSVFYDASAWSLANFYNLSYTPVKTLPKMGAQLTSEDLTREAPGFVASEYAYLIPWEDYYAPAVLNYLQSQGVVVHSAFSPFVLKVGNTQKPFGYGTLMIPVNSRQPIPASTVFQRIAEASEEFGVPVYPVSSGYSEAGVDLGSRYFQPLTAPRALMFIGEGVSSYEAGEVWYLLDQQMNMPITKVPLRLFSRVDWGRYNTLVMVSGSYRQLDSTRKKQIQDWIAKGNTLITIRGASAWAIRQQLVKESLVKEEAQKDSLSVERKPYVQAPEIRGREQVGGSIFEVDLDLTHPLAFGYRERTLPVYRNSTVWIKPSSNAYSTVARYTDDPHIDGFITKRNLEQFLKPSASLIVSPIGRGRVILFADNPNFRGSWLGTHKLFLNALFLGQYVNVPAF